jgi:tRNA nucleotidyltransferase (CCA-adding enzyme)
MIDAPITVSDIMSRGPQLLEPEMSIHVASERMQRFGHEGYPVVDDGVVVGLLTRREVDRAMSHGMGERPITTIMQTGSHTVNADDPIQILQAIMIEHGWGQVAVLDAEGEIIGIVTRTDLIGVLGSRVEEQTPDGLVGELESALSAARLALLKNIAAEAEFRQDALYIVGGFVRDLLLGTPSTDFDLVVEGDAIGVATALVEKFGGRMTSHKRFGTAKWRLDLDNPALGDSIHAAGGDLLHLPSTLDFVTARTEFYTQPTALPSVQQGNIKLDLHRRDFTINTLALRLDGRFYGQLLDYWGGGRDLREGKVRVLHSISFVDDPTRMLRAVRLEQRLGFEIEPRTLELLKQALVLLDRVSGERIRNELQSSFSEDRWLSIGSRLQELGLLQAIDHALTWDEWLAERFSRARQFEPPDRWGVKAGYDLESIFYAIWLFNCSEEKARRVCQRLRFQVAMQEQIIESNRIGHALADITMDAPPSEVTSLLEQYGQIALMAAWLALEDDADRQAMIDHYLTHWRHITPTIDGTTLREAGLAPGPSFRRILDQLRAAWLDGEIATEEAEQQLCKELIAIEQQDG